MTAIPPGLELPDLSVMTELQAHMKKLCEHFNWNEPTEAKFLLLVEEVGELAKAVRRMEKIAMEPGKEIDQDTVRANLAEEMGDIFSYLLDLANGYGVDLAEAYKAKTIANFNRSWK